MGAQYPDINSNPQKIFFHGSLAVSCLASLIMAIFGIIWFAKIEICPGLVTGKPAIVYYLSIVSSIFGLVGVLLFIITFIIFLVYKLKGKVITRQDILVKIHMGKATVICNFIASIFAIACSIFGLNHNENGLCISYLKEVYDINDLCPYGGGPSYAKENAKLLQKLAEDPGYYCEKNGIPLLIVAIINIVSAIAFFVSYCIAKKNPIEESSIAEGQVEIENNQNE